MEDQIVKVSTNDSFSRNLSLRECRLTYTAMESTASLVSITMAYSVLLLFALVGNSLIVALYCKNPGGRLRSPVNCFICNMAVSDLLISALVIPRRIQETYLGWSPWLVDGVLGNVLCKLVNFSDEVSMAVSIQSMVFIAFERFWSIILPMAPAVITARHSSRFIAFTWMFAVSIFFRYFFTHKLTYIDNKLRCEHDWAELFDTWEELWKVDRIIFFILFVAIPFVLLSVFYSAIILCLHRQEKRFSHLALEAQRRTVRENHRVTVMLLLVVILFFIGWTPYYVYIFKHYFSPNSQKWSCGFLQNLTFTAIYLNYVNAGLNPLIYYTFNDTYRRGFRALLSSLRIFSCPRFMKTRVLDTSAQNQDNLERVIQSQTETKPEP